MSSYAEKTKASIYSWDQRGNLKVEHAVIFWTNFRGDPTRFNPAGGKRVFNLGLTPAMAEELTEAGWNVHERAGREEDDDPLFFTEIVVNMKSQYLPRVYLCTERLGKKRMVRLYEDTIGELDNMRYENVDVVIHPHEHNVGAYTFKGYANELIVTQAESELFGGKYAEYEMDERLDGSDEPDADEPPF